MQIRDTLEAAIRTAVGELGLSVDSFTLEHPEVLARGDYATSVALVLAKSARKNPRQLGEEIAAKLREQGVQYVEKIDVAGPGFINFTLAPSFFGDALADILAQSNGSTWGTAGESAGKEVVVEYTDPNPFKAFHIGHLMSNAIGESLARLIESQGTKVTRANYQGDVGIHIACAIWGVQQLGIDPHEGKRLGEAYSYGAVRYKNEDKKEEWVSVKVEIDTLNKIIYEKSDPVVNEMYEVGRKASLDLFEGLYTLLGTKFDRYFFESELGEKGKEIVLGHPEIFEDSDGAKVYKGEKVGLHTRVFLTKKGLPVYETKELALAYAKQELYPKAEKFYVVTANEITEYYKVVVAAMSEINGVLSAKMQHVPHGMMRLPDGKMSSRTGNVVTGESLIADLVAAAEVRASESRLDTVAEKEALAKQIAVAAIKFQVLRQGTGRDIIFEPEKALSLEGDTGPYIQYAHARCCSILEKGKVLGFVPEVRHQKSAGSSLTELERTLYRFPDVVARAATELQPHYVAHFLLYTAGLFNSWYAQVQVLDDSPDVPHKLAIVRAVQATLAQGLHLLGIAAPEKM
jgi:arginyl-tRNA synthetase